MELPSWLFWRLVLSDSKDRVAGQREQMEANAIAFGGYKQEVVREIQTRWRDLSLQGYVNVAPSVSDVYTKGAAPPKMSDKQKEFWQSFGGKVKESKRQKKAKAERLKAQPVGGDVVVSKEKAGGDGDRNDAMKAKLLRMRKTGGGS